MGLIRAGMTSMSSTLADEWKEYIYADTLDNKTALVIGKKKISSKSSNKHGNENIISQNAVIAVNSGQAMIIVEDGKICEYSDEAGKFIFDKSTESSIFSNTLGEGIAKSFQKMGRRFSFGGDSGKDQRVYFFNLKELTDLKFGTSEPLMYDDPVYQSISIRFFGKAVLKIVDPIKFYTNVSGNVENAYSFYNYWNEILKSEFISKLSEAMAKLSLNNIKYNQIPQNQSMLTDYMNECLDEIWFEDRGVVISSVGIESVSLDPKDKDKVDRIDEIRLLNDPLNAASIMTGATAKALENAASNSSGALNGFMGLNMASAQSQKNNIASMYAMAKEEQVKQTSNLWKCSCTAENEGKFCSNCGAKAPVINAKWKCACGTENEGKFCSNCGSKAPVINEKWKCACGAENEGNFCSNCGIKKE